MDKQNVKYLASSVFFFLLTFLFFVPLLLADYVPPEINYQGYVQENGTAFDGTGYVKLALVNYAGDTTYWSNDGTSTAGSEPTDAVTTTVNNGILNVILGDTDLANMQALDKTVFNNGERLYLRVWFSSDGTTYELLSPDRELAATGYAINCDAFDRTIMTSLELDSDNAGSGADITIIANQGSSNDGILKYSEADNKWQYSNDGGAFTDLGGEVTSVFGRNGAINAASDDYTWAQIDKSTSSIADITTRSAGDLSSGNMAVAQMPLGGSWSLTADLNIDTNTLVVDVSDDGVGIGTASPSTNADLTLAGGVLCLKETTTPIADTDHGKIYTKDDNKLYFQDGAGSEAAVLTGTAPVTSVFGRTGAVSVASDDYTWAQIDKSTSSIADITTRSAGDLSSGNLAIARMPTGGNWSLSSDLNLDTNTLVVSQDDDRVGIGTASPNEELTIEGVLSMDETSAPTGTGGYGKIYVADIAGNDANTVLLIHSNAANGNTTFADSSATGHTVSANGHVRHVARKKFQNQISTVYFDGTGDYLSVAEHTDFDFGTGDFTVECWACMYDMPAANAKIQRFLSKDDLNGTNGAWTFGIGRYDGWPGGGANILQLNFGVRVDGSPVNYTSGDFIYAVNNNEWHHYAMVRSSSTVYYFVDGVSVGLSSSAGHSVDSAGSLKVGTGYYSGLVEGLKGFVTEVRVSNTARWTADFTPVGPYEDSALYFMNEDDAEYPLTNEASH